MDFLTNLEILLKNNDMKRADLARAIGVAPSTINSWYARGSEKVSLKVLRDIAVYFKRRQYGMVILWAILFLVYSRAF